MSVSALSGMATAGPRAPAPEAAKSAEGNEAAGIKKRFEQMLWAEMLSHAGLEKAFTQGGGEAASAFSRYVVEEIAKDLAEKHPMGLADKVQTTRPGTDLMPKEASE